MAHLIDKAAVVAEINRILNSYDPNEITSGRYALVDLRDFLDTLEVKEVDIEKEVIDWWNAHYSSKAYKFEGYTGHYVENSTLIEITKHFFELGLKVQNIITPLQQQRISVMKMEFWTGLQTFNESEMTLSDAYNKGIEDILEELGIKAQKGEL